MPASAPDLGTRDRLLDAAVGVFAECGLDGARVQEIARRAGLTTGAIYAQFRGKADLLAAAIESTGIASLGELLAGAAAQGCPPDVVLTALGDELVGLEPDWIEGLLLEAVAAARRDPRVGDILRLFFDGQRAQLADLMEEGKRAGAFADDVDAFSAATFSLALSIGMAACRSLGLAMPDEGAWHQLIRRQVHALAPAEGDS